MYFDDPIIERPPTAGAPPDRPDRHFYEGAVMLAYAMHLLRTEPVREVRIHPDGQHARQIDFPGWLEKRGFRRVAAARSAFAGTFGTKIDRESPALIRTAFQDIHEVTFLASDHFSTRPITTIAFDRRLFPVGDAILSLAAMMDPEALFSVGRFLLWDQDDPSCAMPYLEAAAGRGHVEALLDLLTLTLFPRT